MHNEIRLWGQGLTANLYNYCLILFFRLLFISVFIKIKAFKSNDNDLINSSFEYLKSHYKFIRF
jgi:hypothetical protein